MMANNTLNTFCIDCDAGVSAVVSERTDILDIRGESIEYQAREALCPKCGKPIADWRLEGANLDAAYEAYRIKHGMMSPAAIKELRSEYGLSIREFSRFLGFGEQTIAKYESGSLPDKSHSCTLNLARTIEGARHLLESNGASLSEKSVRKVQDFIAKASAGAQLGAMRNPEGAERPCNLNGYRVLDMERIGIMLDRFASKCNDFYWTKAQKAMYFCDALCYETTGRSMSGARYAHGMYGPIMQDRVEIIGELEQQGVVSTRPCGWGFIIEPGKASSHGLTSEDEAMVDRVADFVNTFSTASELSDYSHKLEAWKQTKNGEMIEYGTVFGQVTKAINSRLKSTKP